MDMQGIIQTVKDFAMFLSKTYGSGNVAFDALVIAALLVASIAVLAFLRMMDSRHSTPLNDAEKFNNLDQALGTLQIQLSELRSTLLEEFQKNRAELGHIKQELADIRARLGGSEFLQSSQRGVTRQVSKTSEMNPLRGLSL